MNEPSLDDLHARLTRLEREVGWWRRVGVVALACAGLAGAVAATVTSNPDEVKTRRLVITDGEGRGRALFTVDESDRTRLMLGDREGATTADLTITPGQSAALSLGRADARAQLATIGNAGQLTLSAHGHHGWLAVAPAAANLGLGHDASRPQVSIATGGQGQGPSVQLTNRDGSAVWKAP